MRPRALPLMLAGVIGCGSRTGADTAPASDTLAPEPDSETGLETEPETETGAETEPETETEFETDTETGTETESERETGADTGMDTGSAPSALGSAGSRPARARPRRAHTTPMSTSARRSRWRTTARTPLGSPRRERLRSRRI